MRRFKACALFVLVIVIVYAIAWALVKEAKSQSIEYSRYLKRQEEKVVVIEIGNPVYQLSSLEK